MSDKINQIVEELKTLTLLEASELVTAIEETFGVDASASVDRRRSGSAHDPKPHQNPVPFAHGNRLDRSSCAWRCIAATPPPPAACAQ